MKTGTLLEGAVHGTNLAAETRFQVIQASADRQAVLRERRLGSAVYDLEEQFTHSRVDGIANEVRVECFKDGLADEDLTSP